MEEHPLAFVFAGLMVLSVVTICVGVFGAIWTSTALDVFAKLLLTGVTAFVIAVVAELVHDQVRGGAG